MSGEMMEFRITSDLNALRSQVIEANFPEVRSWLERNLEPYRNMVVTEDGIAQAKSYRAEIRKVADRIDQSRKEAKAAALAAYSHFEEKCKELTGMCADAANALDAQVKAFEEQEREAKITELRAYYDEGDEEARQFLTWERVYNPSWGNKGYSLVTAKDDISSALERTAQDINSIREVGGEDTPYLLDVYKQTLDISAVMRKTAELKAMREREAERKQFEAGAQKYADLRKSEQRPAPATPESTAEEDIVTIAFKVTCTKAQLTALGQYMRDSGIKYGRA